jgi:hypothetical protein
MVGVGARTVDDGWYGTEHKLAPPQEREPPSVVVDEKARGTAVVLAAVRLIVGGLAGRLHSWLEHVSRRRSAKRRDFLTGWNVQTGRKKGTSGTDGGSPRKRMLV